MNRLLATRETVIIVVVICALSTAFAFFMIGIAAHSSRSSNAADWSRQDDATLNFENGTAIVTVREGQKAGPIIVNLIRPDGRVVFDEIDEEMPTMLPTGGATTVCEFLVDAAEIASDYRIEVLDVTSKTARFEITKGDYCFEDGGPPYYCWHMYHSEIYDDYIAALTAG